MAFKKLTTNITGVGQMIHILRANKFFFGKSSSRSHMFLRKLPDSITGTVMDPQKLTFELRDGTFFSIRACM